MSVLTLPPTPSCFSRSAKGTPLFCNSSAHASPATPAPTITTSVSTESTESTEDDEDDEDDELLAAAEQVPALALPLLLLLLQKVLVR